MILENVVGRGFDVYEVDKNPLKGLGPPFPSPVYARGWVKTS